MHLPPIATCEILKNKGVNSLYHANSVLTSVHILRIGRLISRGNIERDRKLQSSQYSDNEDKKYGIWHDVFTDSVDIHNRAKTYNKYGPVLFESDIDILKGGETGKIWITKLNPTKWAGKSNSQRWFTSKADVEDNFQYGNFDQMIIFRHCGGELEIKKYLKRIILDNPQITWSDKKSPNIDSYSMAYGVLTGAIAESKMKIKVEQRNCQSSCRCISDYDSKKNFSQKMFFPELFEG